MSKRTLCSPCCRTRLVPRPVRPKESRTALVELEEWWTCTIQGPGFLPSTACRLVNGGWWWVTHSNEIQWNSMKFNENVHPTITTNQPKWHEGCESYMDAHPLGLKIRRDPDYVDESSFPLFTWPFRLWEYHFQTHIVWKKNNSFRNLNCGSFGDDSP